MRIALILLSILALVFIGSVTWSLVGQEGWTMKSRSTPASVDSLTLETWKNQIKTEEKIEKLSTMVEELAKSQGTSTRSPTKPDATASGEIIRISGKLLSLLMPTMTLTLSESDGIFGLYIFDQSIAYSTYSDSIHSLKVQPLSVPYDTFLKNIKALKGDPYTVNETSTFPFRSFFVNPTKTDTLVRLVVEVESQTLILEIAKSKYPLLKDLLLGKSVPAKK